MKNIICLWITFKDSGFGKFFWHRLWRIIRGTVWPYCEKCNIYKGYTGWSICKKCQRSSYYELIDSIDEVIFY